MTMHHHLLQCLTMLNVNNVTFDPPERLVPPGGQGMYIIHLLQLWLGFSEITLFIINRRFSVDMVKINVIITL